MYEILLVVYLLAALALIGLVMIQQGKGADMGASFGAGASNTVFGASGSGNFLTRMTAIMAIIFFVVCLVIGNLSAGHGDDRSSIEQQLENNQPVAEQTAPAAPVNTDQVPQ
ncbi:Protein-export membrane protein SecG [Vibrio stylophorae]|uniref:Protein-export membrane protein SecG n=1 Tax=Vibrio stylophorae TaxID=659351 RepID=A0ABM8ZQY1_9VIBR|nr:preprotein translocase subunit SecG [Vibrio stylophorae]CAH0532710.1 Protein-export membrane protein SecG [Vibrio stylophorae]